MPWACDVLLYSLMLRLIGSFVHWHETDLSSELQQAIEVGEVRAFEKATPLFIQILHHMARFRVMQSFGLGGLAIIFPAECSKPMPSTI